MILFNEFLTASLPSTTVRMALAALHRMLHAAQYGLRPTRASPPSLHLFAIDSIHAIFAITTAHFIAFTSNIFAILGLCALYFRLADMVDRYHLLQYGRAMVLTFIGAKILIAPWHHVPTPAL